jgi:CheY-like chemotaxis protein
LGRRNLGIEEFEACRAARQEGNAMNYVSMPQPPFMALVDDDSHSARLITRMLLAHGAPAVQWLDGAESGAGKLGELLADRRSVLPGLVIVDLKTSSSATRDFIAGIRKLERSDALLIAAVAPTLDREVRDSLLEAGADAVFQRHGDIDAYRREAASIVSFWVRNQHLNAIGT